MGTVGRCPGTRGRSSPAKKGGPRESIGHSLISRETRLSITTVDKHVTAISRPGTRFDLHHIGHARYVKFTLVNLLGNSLSRSRFFLKEREHRVPLGSRRREDGEGRGGAGRGGGGVDMYHEETGMKG